MGGGVKNRFWVQNKADILGRELEIVTTPDVAPRGAAMIAGSGSDCFRDFRDAADRFAQPSTKVSPNLELTEFLSQALPGRIPAGPGPTYALSFPAGSFATAALEAGVQTAPEQKVAGGGLMTTPKMPIPVSQVALVVSDLENPCAHIAKPWAGDRGPSMSTTRPACTTPSCAERPAPSPGSVRRHNVGSTYVELLQPLEGPSLFREFMDQHGEGLHHIGYWAKPWRKLRASSRPSRRVAYLS